MSVLNSLSTAQKKDPSGGPFVAGSAVNGVSVDPVSGKIVLGNNVGAVLAVLLSNREIPMAGFNIAMSGATGNLLIGTTADNAKGRLQVNGRASFLNGALFIAQGGFGGAPSLETTSFLTIRNTSNIVIEQGVGAGIPEFRLTNADTTTVNAYSGIISGFNFNGGAFNPQDLLVVTSAINVEINGTSGNIVLQPNSSTVTAFSQVQNADWNVFLKPSRNGIVRLTNNGAATALDGNLLMCVGSASFYGSQFAATKTVTVDTVLGNSDSTVFVDATAGNVLITLPTAASSFKNALVGRQYTIVKIDASANTVTVAAAGGDTIDGVASVLSALFTPVRVNSAGGTSWFQI